MGINLALLLHILLYAIVVSQPLFYLVAFGTASARMKAPAYIEMRNHIDDLMQQRGSKVYYAALGSSVLFSGLALFYGPTLLWITSLIALVCLLLDIRVMFQKNLPINGIIKTWTPTQYPPDWEQYRGKWLQAFAYRQFFLVAGFVALLVGAVFT